jgi:hypothetical protein
MPWHDLPVGRMTRVADWWLTDRSTGRWVAGQPPNPALVVAVGATVVRVSSLLPPSTDEAVRWVGTGAWVVWGLDELLRGASPFRRLLGVLVLAWQVASLR